MFKHVLSSSAGEINWMALSALLTFFVIFSIVIFQIIFQRKEHNKYMSELPFKNKIDHNND